MRLLVRSVFGVAALQDGGRFGHRRFGVPEGGAFDRGSLRRANALLGNPLEAAGLEFALGTLELACASGGALAVVGAASRLSVGGSELGCNSVLSLSTGDVLTVHPPVRGLRTYLAIGGGFAGRSLLGSLSGQAVSVGDELCSSSDSGPLWSLRCESPPSLGRGPFRVVSLGEGEEWTGAEYSVGRSIDRVGLRLEGPKPMVDARSGRSEPSVAGVVQVTEDRTLIVHGPDGPTIGGYKKLGCVVRADLDRVGQLAPGDAVTFESVSRDAAVALWRAHLEEEGAALEALSVTRGGHGRA